MSGMTSTWTAVCSTCQTGREIAEIMGKKYFVFKTCGHVEPISNFADQEEAK